MLKNPGRERTRDGYYSRLLSDRINLPSVSQVNDTVATCWSPQDVCIFSLKIQNRHPPVHQIPPVARSLRDSRFTIRCNTSPPMLRHTAWGTAEYGSDAPPAGAPGKRHSLPSSRIMIHQPLAGWRGTATDLDIHAKEVIQNGSES
ncbi:UNVERIFIED_CONTAM: hypothetical protein GTU68_062910 [Idotea baltica]|nr:hypothetical protein [Idotea baltica]